MPRIVVAIPAFDAQARVIRRTVTPLDVQDPIVFDVIGELTTHTAIRAERIDRPVGFGQRDLARRHEGAGRAGLYALSATDTSGCAHRVVHIENNLRVLAARGEPDHIIHLFIAASAHATRALDAGIEIDGDRRVRIVRHDCRPRRKARLADF